MVAFDFMFEGPDRNVGFHNHNIYINFDTIKKYCFLKGYGRKGLRQWQNFFNFH